MVETYGFVFCGFDTVGVGVFTVVGSRLSGRDAGGGHYEGVVSVDADSGEVTAKLAVFTPRGFGVKARPPPAEGGARRNPVTMRFPPRFGDGAPVTIHIPPGPVVVIVKRIDDSYAPLSKGFVLSPTASEGAG
jgi:hypothetical protein